MKKFLRNLFSVRKSLFFLLLLSISYAGYCSYYKVKYWGFTFSPKKTTDVWTIDAKVSFKPISDNVEISLAVPNNKDSFEILSEEIVGEGYDILHDKKESRIVFKGQNKKGKQNVYYRLNIFDAESGVVELEKPKKIKRPIFSQEEEFMMFKIWELAELQEGNKVQRAIKAVNLEVANPTMSLVLPMKHTQKEFAEKIINVLAFKRIPARIARALKLEEGKKTEQTEIMVEAFYDNKWSLYDLGSAQIGLPKNWIVFQRGGVSQLDVFGGEDSKVRFSVLKSVATPLKMAEYRARNSSGLVLPFEYSVYSLPVLEQNTLKWLMIFPLAILVVVIMRNVIGVSTMGTFTPMLLAMALVKTGFISGLACFSVMIFLGLLMRGVVARMNLLLVPRISFVVIFVILLIQVLTIVGYRLNYEIISSAIFFPIIITAWIIERASITWEEDGAKNTIKEIFNTLMTAIVTYFVISNEFVRHFMFAFNEFNIVIMFVVMLLGTYTGYRLTELARFAPLVNKVK